MAGRLVQKRGLTERERKALTALTERHGADTRLSLQLVRWFQDISVEKYMAGYHCGYKRGKRGSMKEDFDEDRQ